MNMHVCVYVCSKRCMHVCMQICRYIGRHVCLCLHMYACMNVHMYSCVETHPLKAKHKCLPVCIFLTVRHESLCMFVYIMYACSQTFKSVCMCDCMYSGRHISMSFYVHMNTCIYDYMHKYMMYACRYVCTCAQMCIYVKIHVYRHTYMNVYIEVCM